MPKIKIFLCQLGTLLRRGIQLDPLFLTCLNDLEDSDHIFLHCPMTHEVWDIAVAY